jgi:hypothetical protein
MGVPKGATMKPPRALLFEKQSVRFRNREKKGKGERRCLNIFGRITLGT